MPAKDAIRLTLPQDGRQDEKRGRRAQTFWATLLPEELKALQRAGASWTFRTGQVILEQGDLSRHALLLVDGAAKVSVVSENGREVLLAVRGPGELIGELAAMTGLPRTARVTALGQVRAFALPVAMLEEVLRRHPRMANVLLGVVAARLEESDRRRVEVAAHPVRMRVAARIVDLAEQFGEPTREGIRISAHLSQQDLADWTSASREAVARAFQRLRERGAIATGRLSIVVLRPEVLCAEAGSARNCTDHPPTMSHTHALEGSMLMT